MTAAEWRRGIRAVFVDAVGTLLIPSPSASAIYAQVGLSHGSQRSAAEIGQRFWSAFAHEEQLDARTGWRTSEDRELQRWQRIVGSVLDDAADTESCFRVLYDHFRQPSSWRCEPEALATLSRLAEQGYVIGIASNFDSRLRHVLAGFPEVPLRHVVISAEIGWRKPAPEFFAALCRQVHCAPAEVLFVGDDWTNDYLGAANAGLRAVWFDPEEKGTETTACRITRWQELG
ncbi:MAG: HAD-IA family hydrolase [Gemmataceae bacterium]